MNVRTSGCPTLNWQKIDMEMASTKLERESETVDGIEDKSEEFPNPPRDETTTSEGSGKDFENSSEVYFQERNYSPCTEVTRRYMLRDRRPKEYKDYITKVENSWD